MNARFTAKSTASVDLDGPNFKVHQASFQAYKSQNEDRTAVLHTHYGLIVGVFDGHYDNTLSEYASKHLMKAVDERISTEITKDSATLDDTIPNALVDTIQKFDATLHETLISRLRAMDPKPWNEWTGDDIPLFLGMKEQGEHDPYPVMRRSCVGSTALIAVIILKNSCPGEQTMWVASLGDSEGYLGRIVNNVLTATPLNDFHNLYNIAEIQRLQEEHPNEDDLIRYHRVKGNLGVTRALGDNILKAPLDLAYVLSMMWGCPIFSTTVAEWARAKHTPPYISSTASVMRFSIRKGDILIFTSDGLRSTLEEQGIPSGEVGNMIVSLAGMDLLDRETLSSWEKIIGHSFISSADIINTADGVIRNILFGLDDFRMAQETMSMPEDNKHYPRDDMSLVVVNVL